MEELMWVDILISCQYFVTLDKITSLPPHFQCQPNPLNIRLEM